MLHAAYELWRAHTTANSKQQTLGIQERQSLLDSQLSETFRELEARFRNKILACGLWEEITLPAAVVSAKTGVEASGAGPSGDCADRDKETVVDLKRSQTATSSRIHTSVVKEEKRDGDSADDEPGVTDVAMIDAGPIAEPIAQVEEVEEVGI